DIPPIPFQNAILDAVFMAFTLELFPDDTIPIVLGEPPDTSPWRPVSTVSMALDYPKQRHRAPEPIYDWMQRHFPHIVDGRPIDVERSVTDAGFTIRRIERVGIWGLPVAAVLAYLG